MTPLAVLDLWSKAAVFAFLADRYTVQQPRETLWSHAVWSAEAPLRFHLVAWRNTGTIWGLGKDFTAPLVVLRAAAIVLVLYFARRLPPQARLLQVVLGAILAGAIGNLYDNLTQPDGGVRDFLLFSAMFGDKVWQWPAFNVADSCICVGAVTLAILLVRRDGERPAPAPTPDRTGPATPAGTGSTP